MLFNFFLWLFCIQTGAGKGTSGHDWSQGIEANANAGCKELGREATVFKPKSRNHYHQLFVHKKQLRNCLYYLFVVTNLHFCRPGERKWTKPPQLISGVVDNRFVVHFPVLKKVYNAGWENGEFSLADKNNDFPRDVIVSMKL